MKFGKKFKSAVETSVTEWMPFWLDYSLLKKKIKLIRDQEGELEVVEAPKVTSAEVMSQRTGEVEFFRLMDAEVRKGNIFFANVEQQFILRTRSLQEGLRLTQHILRDRAADLPGSFTDNQRTGMWTKLVRAAASVYAEVLLLENYAILNYCAFSKILKKHDRWTGFACRERYLRHVLQKQPFAQYLRLLRLVREVDALFRDLAARLPDAAQRRRYEEHIESARRFADAASRQFGSHAEGLLRPANAAAAAAAPAAGGDAGGGGSVPATPAVVGGGGPIVAVGALGGGASAGAEGGAGGEGGVGGRAAGCIFADAVGDAVQAAAAVARAAQEAADAARVADAMDAAAQAAATASAAAATVSRAAGTAATGAAAAALVSQLAITTSAALSQHPDRSGPAQSPEERDTGISSSDSDTASSTSASAPGGGSRAWVSACARGKGGGGGGDSGVRGAGPMSPRACGLDTLAAVAAVTKASKPPATTSAAVPAEAAGSAAPPPPLPSPFRPAPERGQAAIMAVSSRGRQASEVRDGAAAAAGAGGGGGGDGGEMRAAARDGTPPIAAAGSGRERQSRTPPKKRRPSLNDGDVRKERRMS